MNRAPSLLCGIVVLLAWSRTSPAAEHDARPAGRQVDLIVGATANEMRLLEPPIRDMLAAKGLAVAITRKRTVTTEDVARRRPWRACSSISRLRARERSC